MRSCLVTLIPLRLEATVQDSMDILQSSTHRMETMSHRRTKSPPTFWATLLCSWLNIHLALFLSSQIVYIRVDSTLPNPPHQFVTSILHQILLLSSKLYMASWGTSCQMASPIRHLTTNIHRAYCQIPRACDMTIPLIISPSTQFPQSLRPPASLNLEMPLWRFPRLSLKQ
jgi:hypothetical protein